MDYETYPKVEKALKTLEFDEDFRYLPNFECCGSCAGARLHGYMHLPPDEEFLNLNHYATFNEQTGENAADNSSLYLTVGSKTDEAKAIALVREALLEAGLKENIEPPQVGNRLDVTAELWNSFYINDYGFVIYGGFSELEAKYEDEEDDWKEE